MATPATVPLKVDDCLGDVVGNNNGAVPPTPLSSFLLANKTLVSGVLTYVNDSNDQVNLGMTIVRICCRGYKDTFSSENFQGELDTEWSTVRELPCLGAMVLCF